jgi:hypothetical protein
MKLYDIIPDNSENWSINKDIIFYKKYQNIPVCLLEDNIAYIYLENKIPSQIIKLVRHLLFLKTEFYFLPTEYSNPKAILDNNKVIEHYLFSYTQRKFFYGFRKIKFDLIKNLVDWANRENCASDIKKNYDDTYKSIFYSYKDFQSSIVVFNYDLEIREDYKTLYRQIQINQLM